MSGEKLGSPNPAPSSRRSTIDTLFVRKADPTNSVVSSDKDRVRTGAIAAMGTSLREMTDNAESAARLQKQIDEGAVVIDIESADVDASMVSDRLVADIDAKFDELVESMRTSGQQVPILVRPAPTRGRYQIVYGRRRLRAAGVLGIKVRAIVRSLTDAELIVAQGRENLDRKDLSFMEKALFAKRLDEGGYDRSVIVAALSTDKGDLSRYISVARAVPLDLITAIGPAGKAGRARWMALIARLALPGMIEVAEARIASADFKGLDSDARFASLLAAVSARAPGVRNDRAWTNVRGQKAGRIEHRSDRTILTIDENVAPDFGRFVADRLDDLYAQFLKPAGRKRGG